MQLAVEWQFPGTQTPPLQMNAELLYSVWHSVSPAAPAAQARQNIVPVLQIVPLDAQLPATRQLPWTQAPEPLQRWSGP